MIVPLNLDAVWLNLQSDPSQALQIATVSRRDPGLVTPGETRMYGNGRYVGLSSGGPQQQFQVTFQAVDWDTWLTLKAWAGKLLLYRDDLGNRVWGRYLNPQPTSRTSDGYTDVSITFEELTYSEAV